MGCCSTGSFSCNNFSFTCTFAWWATSRPAAVSAAWPTQCLPEDLFAPPHVCWLWIVKNRVNRATVALRCTLIKLFPRAWWWKESSFRGDWAPRAKGDSRSVRGAGLPRGGSEATFRATWRRRISTHALICTASAMLSCSPSRFACLGTAWTRILASRAGSPALSVPLLDFRWRLDYIRGQRRDKQPHTSHHANGKWFQTSRMVWEYGRKPPLMHRQEKCCTWTELMLLLKVPAHEGLPRHN